MIDFLNQPVPDWLAYTICLVVPLWTAYGLYKIGGADLRSKHK